MEAKSCSDLSCEIPETALEGFAKHQKETVEGCDALKLRRKKVQSSKHETHLLPTLRKTVRSGGSEPAVRSLTMCPFEAERFPFKSLKLAGRSTAKDWHTQLGLLNQPSGAQLTTTLRLRIFGRATPSMPAMMPALNWIKGSNLRPESLRPPTCFNMS